MVLSGPVVTSMMTPAKQNDEIHLQDPFKRCHLLLVLHGIPNARCCSAPSGCGSSKRLQEGAGIPSLIL